MNDIVERLQEFAGPRYPDDICGKACMGEAADEIVRLRAALLSIANNTGCVEACPCWAKLRQRAERALLEAGR